MLDRKAEILFCLEQLRPLGVALPDVVAFYVRHHAHKGNPTLSELVELFVAEKRRIGRSAHYEQSMRYYLNGFMSCAGRNVRISDITREQIADYVYTKNADAGVVTKKIEDEKENLTKIQQVQQRKKELERIRKNHEKEFSE